MSFPNNVLSRQTSIFRNLSSRRMSKKLIRESYPPNCWDRKWSGHSTPSAFDSQSFHASTYNMFPLSAAVSHRCPVSQLSERGYLANPFNPRHQTMKQEQISLKICSQIACL